jgi:adenosylhomocysteinase
MASHIDWAYSKLDKTKEAIAIFKKHAPYNAKILICSHLEAKLISFAKLLHEEGFEVHLISNLPTSVKKDLIPEINLIGLRFYDTSFLNFEESESLIAQIINETNFDFVFDDGAHTYSKLVQPSDAIFTEFTQSGINKANAHDLKASVINLNSSFAKRVIGNIYGTGISTMAAIQTLTNINFHGLNVGVLGFGPIGLSCAIAFKGAGANVMAFDINPKIEERALKNSIQFTTKSDLLRNSDLIITCTGQKHVISSSDFSMIKNGCIMANVGHFNNEIDLTNLVGSIVTSEIKNYNWEEKKFYVLADGNLVNLTTGMGYPIQIIDASFAAAVHSWLYFHKKQQFGLLDYPEILDKTYFKNEIEQYKDLT